MPPAEGISNNNNDSTNGSNNSDAGEERKQKRTWQQFMRKYFLEGQKLDLQVVPKISSISTNSNGISTLSSSPPELPFHERYRKYIGFLLPALFMQLVWWILAIRYNFFALYPNRYALAITMIFGATIAGATSEGGGAVAFPVMTLLLHIDSLVARDFSLMIQSCGMTSSAFTILWMRIMVEWHSVIFCTIGSTFGIVLGLQFVDDVFDGPTKKMLFVSIWFSFAIALFLLNRQHKRVTHLEIKDFCAWKAVLLLLTGFIGGLYSAFSGSGVDICSFSILTLLFRVSEKIATPTSVLLMAANTLVGFFWRELIQRGISVDAWEYFAVSVPVVVVCGPFGALISSHCHRQVLAATVYILEALALLGFLMTMPPFRLIAIGAAIIVFSFFFFLGVCHLGNWLDTDDNAGSIRINLMRHRRDKVASVGKDAVNIVNENGHANDEQQQHEEKQENRRVTLGEHLRRIATFWRNKRMEVKQERNPNDTP